MTATVSQVRAGLQTRLATISGLHAYGTWPDSIITPCALVRPMSGTYHVAMSSPGMSEVTFEVVLLANAVQKGLKIAQTLLDAYLDPSGAQSLKAAIEGDVTLGGVATTLIVTGWSGYGSLQVGDVEYLGAVLAVSVWP